MINDRGGNDSFQTVAALQQNLLYATEKPRLAICDPSTLSKPFTPPSKHLASSDLGFRTSESLIWADAILFKPWIIAESPRTLISVVS